ncbi:MAG: hypothetical protein JNL74_07035, partial [Fibrobacteres bacterium]|nr:hypothetical protein [Fibrobacterota bacterium]
MISKHHIVLFIALTSPIFIFSQISTINLGFKRIINERNHLDSAEGFILYDKSGLIRISINKPVEQRMTLNGSSMLIYYPQEKKAFKIIGRSVFDLPFIQSFMMALQPKSFLEKQGFTCDTQYNSSSYQSKARWNPPEKAKKLIGAIELY